MPNVLHKEELPYDPCDFNMSPDSRGQVTQLFGPLSHTPKGCGVDPWSGHILRLWVQSPLGVYTGGNKFMFSHISLSLSLSKINKYILR